MVAAAVWVEFFGSGAVESGEFFFIHFLQALPFSIEGAGRFSGAYLGFFFGPLEGAMTAHELLNEIVEKGSSAIAVIKKHDQVSDKMFVQRICHCVA